MATNGTLNFAAGETSKTVNVLVNGDQLDEIDETFTLNLANPVNVSIADGNGLGTITDDDPLPALAIADVTVTEGDSGTVAATFTVNLSDQSGRAASVNYATADGTAIAPGDYVAASGALNFAAGQTTRTVTVRSTATSWTSSTRTSRSPLESGQRNHFGPQGVGTISDDDGLPSVSVSDATVTEGNGNSVTASFTLSLNAASGQPATVSYATADGTATAPADYTALPLTAITFAPGQVTRTVSVTVAGDVLDEIDESFTLNLSNPVNATISDPDRAGRSRTTTRSRRCRSTT